MARDVESLKIRRWAETGDRTDPEEAMPPMDRDKGWGLQYGQIGGDEISRGVVNQMFREVTGMLVELNEGGSIPEWNAAFDYEYGAFVRYGLERRLFVCFNVDGAGGLAPSANSVWREY